MLLRPFFTSPLDASAINRSRSALACRQTSAARAVLWPMRDINSRAPAVPEGVGLDRDVIGSHYRATIATW
ncbi:MULTISPECIES: hypothetical protein [unclassified Streptomyces]|uniref:hypothetical protein n=1 Tax=unclassified Streptomyces TaxID=2593676 RepID=UPI003320F9AF